MKLERMLIDIKIFQYFKQGCKWHPKEGGVLGGFIFL